MAQYRLSVEMIRRSQGHQAVQKAAYRSNQRLHDARTGELFDYTDKGDLVHSAILLPTGAPAEYEDRATLWNAVEASERRPDSRLARDVELMLPRELSLEQSIPVAQAFVQEQFIDLGMAADVNVHHKIASDGLPQPHVHAMLTLRQPSPNGFGAVERTWNEVPLLKRWRSRWAEMLNDALARHDHAARVDHRSYAARGLPMVTQRKVSIKRVQRQLKAGDPVIRDPSIARRCGERLLAQPQAVLDMVRLEHGRCEMDGLGRFVRAHTDGAIQADALLGTVLTLQEAADHAVPVSAPAEAATVSAAPEADPTRTADAPAGSTIRPSPGPDTQGGRRPSLFEWLARGRRQAGPARAPILVHRPIRPGDETDARPNLIIQSPVPDPAPAATAPVPSEDEILVSRLTSDPSDALSIASALRRRPDLATTIRAAEHLGEAAWLAALRHLSQEVRVRRRVDDAVAAWRQRTREADAAACDVAASEATTARLGRLLDRKGADDEVMAYLRDHADELGTAGHHLLQAIVPPSDVQAASMPAGPKPMVRRPGMAM